MTNELAQSGTDLGNPLSGGSAAIPSTPDTSPSVFNRIISTTVGLLTVIASIYFLFLVITAAISWMSAGGDKGKIEDARQRLTNGVIGLAITVAAVFLLSYLGPLLGLPYIRDPGGFIRDLPN